MAIDYAQLMCMPERETCASYGPRDVILYALGVGVGAEDPTSPTALRYVYESGLQAIPTMAVTIASPGFWLRSPIPR